MSQQIELKLGLQEDNHVHPKRFTLPAVIEAESRGKPRSAPTFVKARAAILPKNIPAEDAFRLTLLQCQWHIAANIPAVVESREIEGLHQMRVGFRRLRVALTSFGSDFRNSALEALRARAQKLAEKLAPARDLDVFITELLEPAARANGAVESFDLLRARAGEARRTAWDFAAAHVLSPAFAQFMSDFGDAINRRAWLSHSGRIRKNQAAFEAPASELADRVLGKRLKSSLKRGKHFNKLSDEDRHLLRISLKKLRYTAEFFAPFYDSDEVVEFTLRLSDMQDILGAVNDVVVARETLAKLTHMSDDMAERPSADMSFAAGIVYGWHLDRAAHIVKKGGKRWKAFARSKPFWHQETKH